MEQGTMLKLSDVQFNELAHTYTRDGVMLSGITGLIHSVLQLGVYPEATERVKQINIPQAGYYGSCVHQAIQTLEQLGIEEPNYPEKNHQTRDFGMVTFPAHDVTSELANYKEVMDYYGFHCIASEYLVDYGSFATAIDNVSEDGLKDIWLIDYKTNNLKYYPGGEDALKEYLSWQLSCNAYMLERMNPGKQVKGLIGLWLRGKDRKVWDIERKNDDQVECLLNTITLKGDDGWVYLNDEMQVAPAETKPTVADTSLVVPSEITTAIANLLKAEAAAKVMKERLRELMETNGITKWECDQFAASISKTSEAKSFDSKAFEKDNPELYKKYIKTTQKKGSFKITAK